MNECWAIELQLDFLYIFLTIKVYNVFVRIQCVETVLSIEIFSATTQFPQVLETKAKINPCSKGLHHDNIETGKVLYPQL